MLEKWQFNVLFFVGVVGAIAMLTASYFGFESNPTAATGIGAILIYVLNQKTAFTKKPEPKKDKEEEETQEGSDE